MIINMEIKKYFNIKSLLIVLIFIIGFYLRICHIAHGTHYIFNHDGQNFIEQALRCGKGALKPLGMLHGPFLPYILFFEYGLYFLINLLIGKMSCPTDLLKEYVIDPSKFFMIGGLTIVFFSIGVMFLVNFICKKYFNEKIALCATLFTAVSFYMVYLAHVIKEDILVGFFILYSYYFALKALNTIRWSRPFYISALFVGLAVSVKYYAFIGVFIILAALIFKLKDREITVGRFFGIFFKSAVIITSIFVILNPYAIINFKGFINGLTGLGNVFFKSSDLYNRQPLLLYSIFSIEGIGWPVFLLYLSSFFFIFSNRNILLCNVFPIFLYLFFSFFKRVMPYFLVSAFPFILISSAFSLVKLSELFVKNGACLGLSPGFLGRNTASHRGARNLGTRHRGEPAIGFCGGRMYKKVCAGFIFVIAILCASVTFVVSWKFCRVLNAEDTRIIAKRWVESNIKEDSKILIEGSYTFNIISTPQLRENMNTLELELRAIKESGGSGFLWTYKKECFNMQKGVAYELYKTIVISLDDIKRYAPEYVILTSYQSSSISARVNNYLQGEYELVKNIPSDVSTYCFPSFESLSNGIFERLNSLNLKSLNGIRYYGPAIEIYKKISRDSRQKA